MSPEQEKPRRGLSFRLVGGIFAGTIALAVVFVAIVYVTMIRYEPVAAAHLPADSSSALRIDLEKVVLYEPFREHFLPLANELAKGSASTPRLERIRRATRIDFAVDLREIAFALGARETDWVLVVGGKFPKSGVVKGFAEVLREEGFEPELVAGGERLLLPGGAALGQASDGALILASSAERLERALPSQDTWQKLGLTLEPAATFSISSEIVGRVAARVGVLGELGRAERVSGSLALGQPLLGTAKVALRPGTDSNEAAENAKTALKSLLAIVRLTGTDLLGEAALLETAEVSPAGPNALEVAFRWRREDLDRGAESLANAIRRSARP